MFWSMLGQLINDLPMCRYTFFQGCNYLNFHAHKIYREKNGENSLIRLTGSSTKHYLRQREYDEVSRKSFS